MNSKNTKILSISQSGLPKGFRQTGTFTYQGNPVDLYLDRKSGQLAFVENSQLVTDPQRLADLMDAFQKVNRIS